MRALLASLGLGRVGKMDIRRGLGGREAGLRAEDDADGGSP